MQLNDDMGPWNDYEIVESKDMNAEVGIRQKGDLFGRVYTSRDIAALENPVIGGPGVMGTKGAMILKDDG